MIRARNYVLVALLALVACAGGEPKESAPNPDTHCAAQGYARDSADYAKCVDDYIASICIAKGNEAGTAGFAQCAQQLRDSTFLRQQLQIWGR